MHRRHLALVLLATLAAGACATVQTVDPELRRKAAKVSILTAEELGARPHAVVGEVLGVSCARQRGSNPSMSGARQDLRVQAAKVGADAVINTFCEEGGTTLERNCWKTVQCRGDAIRWQR